MYVTSLCKDTVVYSSIQYCLAVHLKWQDLLHSTSQTLAFFGIKPHKFMAKITVTILQLLLETTGCGNFKTMLMRSITAVSSISGRQNIQHVGRLFRKLVLLLHFLDQPNKIFHCFLCC
jgi:hypothetical protein